MKRFKKYLISKLVPDYFDIKAKNKELMHDIYNLINKSDEIEGIQTKIFWKIYFDAEDMLWAGDGCNTEFKGLFNKIKPNERQQTKKRTKKEAKRLRVKCSKALS